VWRGTGPLYAGPSCLILRSSYADATGLVSGCRLAKNPGLGVSSAAGSPPVRCNLEHLGMLPHVSPVHRPPDRWPTAASAYWSSVSSLPAHASIARSRV
jgi:hypothetical protein